MKLPLSPRSLARGRAWVLEQGRDAALAALRSSLGPAPQTVAVSCWPDGVTSTRGGIEKGPNRELQRWELSMPELTAKLTEYASRTLPKSTGWSISHATVAATGGSLDVEARERTALFCDSDDVGPPDALVSLLRELDVAHVLSVRGKKFHLDIPYSRVVPCEHGSAAKLLYRERCAYLLGVFSELGVLEQPGLDYHAADRYLVQTFAYTRLPDSDVVPTVDGHDGARALDWDLALSALGWTPEAAPLRPVRAAKVVREQKAARLVRPAEEYVPREEWERAAALIGGALGRISESWHDLSQALAGACFERGIPLDDGPAFLAMCVSASDDANTEGHGSHSIASVQHNARSTAKLLSDPTDERTARGMGYLRAYHPKLAEAVDRALPQLGASRELRAQLDARGVAEEVSRDEGRAILNATIANAAPGLTVLRATAGAGKTHALTAHAIEQAKTIGDAPIPQRRKLALVPSMHAVAETAFERLDAGGVPAVYLRGIDLEQCELRELAKPLASAGQSVGFALCEGGGRGEVHRCPHYKECPGRLAARPRAVNKIDDQGALAAVTVHALAPAAHGHVGDHGLLAWDEGAATHSTALLSPDALDLAAKHTGLRSTRAHTVAGYLAAGLRVAPLGASVREVWELGCAAEKELAGEILAREFAASAAWMEGRKEGTWQRRGWYGPRFSVAAHEAMRAGRMPAGLAGASATMAAVARAFVATFDLAGLRGGSVDTEFLRSRVEAHADGTPRLRLLFAEGSVLSALGRAGPTVLLDATADVAALRALVPDVRVVDVRVRDGAPVARTVLYFARASRKGCIPTDETTRWEELAPYLEEAVRLAAVPDGGSLALFTWLRLEQELQLAWEGSQYPHDGIERILRGLKERRVAVCFGHFGATRGRDEWMTCDALITFGDPRPNLGETRATAALLGLDDAEHARQYEHAVAAELEQAHGRLRAPQRTTPATAVHVGTVPPLSWDSRANVLEMPRGQAKLVEGGSESTQRRRAAEHPVTAPAATMTADEIRAEFARLGWSQTTAARVLGVSQSTISRWVTGRLPVTVAESYDWAERALLTAAGMRLCTSGQIPPSEDTSEGAKRPSVHNRSENAVDSSRSDQPPPAPPRVVRPPALPGREVLVATARALGWRTTSDAARALHAELTEVAAWQRGEVDVPSEAVEELERLRASAHPPEAVSGLAEAYSALAPYADEPDAMRVLACELRYGRTVREAASEAPGAIASVLAWFRGEFVPPEAVEVLELLRDRAAVEEWRKGALWRAEELTSCGLSYGPTATQAAENLARVIAEEGLVPPSLERLRGLLAQAKGACAAA